MLFRTEQNKKNSDVDHLLSNVPYGAIPVLIATETIPNRTTKKNITTVR